MEGGWSRGGGWGDRITRRSWWYNKLRSKWCTSLRRRRGLNMRYWGRRNQRVEYEDHTRELIFEDPVVLSNFHHSSSCTKCLGQFILPIRDNSLHFLRNFQIKAFVIGLRRERYLAFRPCIMVTLPAGGASLSSRHGWRVAKSGIE